MPPCSKITCSRSKRRRGDDDDDDQDASTSTDKIPSLTIADHLANLWRATLSLFYDFGMFWYDTYKDPYGFQLMKSTVYFAVGIKFIHAAAVYLKPETFGSALFAK